MARINKRLFGPNGIKVQTDTGIGHIISQRSTYRFKIDDGEGNIKVASLGATADEETFAIPLLDAEGNSMTVKKLNGRTLVAHDGLVYRYNPAAMPTGKGEVGFGTAPTDGEGEPEPEPLGHERHHAVFPTAAHFELSEETIGGIVELYDHYAILGAFPHPTPASGYDYYGEYHYPTVEGYYESLGGFTLHIPNMFDGEIEMTTLSGVNPFRLEGNTLRIDTVPEVAESCTILLSDGTINFEVKVEPATSLALIIMHLNKDEPFSYRLAPFLEIEMLHGVQFDRDGNVGEENNVCGFYQTHAAVDIMDYMQAAQDQLDTYEYNRDVSKVANSEPGVFQLRIMSRDYESDMFVAYYITLIVE